MQLVLHAPRWMMAAIPKRECTGRPGLSLAGLKVMRPRRVHEALLNSSRRAALLCSAPASPCSPALQGRAVPSIVQSSCPLFIIYQSLCCCLCLAASAPPHHARLVRSNSFTPAGSPLFWAVVISLPHLDALGRSCLSTFHPSRAAKSPRSPAVLQAAPSTRTHDTPTPTATATPSPTTPSRHDAAFRRASALGPAASAP